MFIEKYINSDTPNEWTKVAAGIELSFYGVIMGVIEVLIVVYAIS